MCLLALNAIMLHLHIILCVAQHDIQHQLHTATHCMLFLGWSLMLILSSFVYKTLGDFVICTRVCASHTKSCSGSNEISLDSLAAQAMPSGARCASQIQMFTSPIQLHTSNLEPCPDSCPYLHMCCTALAHTHEEPATTERALPPQVCAYTAIYAQLKFEQTVPAQELSVDGLLKSELVILMTQCCRVQSVALDCQGIRAGSFRPFA